RVPGHPERGGVQLVDEGFDLIREAGLVRHGSSTVGDPCDGVSRRVQSSRPTGSGPVEGRGGQPEWRPTPLRCGDPPAS
ncbi:MAG: hypothetical protein U0S13_00740, partial [Mycobacterium sp.]